MDDPNLPAPTAPQSAATAFEQIKRVNQHGAEYWSARDLQVLLGYSQWCRFEDAITRAFTSCTQSGNDPAHHFAGAGKMIAVGKGGNREVPDFHLSRFACYLMDRMDTTELAANQFRMTQALPSWTVDVPSAKMQPVCPGYGPPASCRHRRQAGRLRSS